MDYNNIKPSESYEGLRKQFLAMKALMKSKDAELEVYRRRVKEFSMARIIQLESELESQKEMNAILTEELNQYTQTP